MYVTVRECYQYNREQLLASPELPLICMTDSGQVFETMMKQMAEEIKDHNTEGEKTVFICPVGPVDQYPYFVDMANGRNVSLKNMWSINMDGHPDDDKHWVSMEHPLSFRGFMEWTVYSKARPGLMVPKEQRAFPGPENIIYILELIEELSDVGIVFGGIDISGHVAFNEAGPLLSNQELLAQEIRVLRITPKIRTASAIGDSNGALEDMPKCCVTIGTYEIVHARKIRPGCFRNWHRAVMRRTTHGESTVEFPVTLLHNHSDITLAFTDYVAALTD